MAVLTSFFFSFFFFQERQRLLQMSQPPTATRKVAATYTHKKTAPSSSTRARVQEPASPPPAHDLSRGSIDSRSYRPQAQPHVEEMVVEDVPLTQNNAVALRPYESEASTLDPRNARLVAPAGGGGATVPQREVRVDERTKAKAFRQRDSAGNTMCGYTYNSSDDPTFQNGNMHVQSSCFVYTSGGGGASFPFGPDHTQKKRSRRGERSGAPVVEEPDSDDEPGTDHISHSQPTAMRSNRPPPEVDFSRAMQPFQGGFGRGFFGDDDFFGRDIFGAHHAMMMDMMGMDMMGFGMGRHPRGSRQGGMRRPRDIFDDDFFAW